MLSLLLALLRTPTPPLFPYTTLFRSRAKLAGHQAGVGAVIYSDDGKALATGDADGHLRIFDSTSLREVVRVKAHEREDRKSTRLNSSHLGISYAVFCLKKKKNNKAHD